MSDKRTSELPAAASALGADEIHVNEAGTDKKVTVTQLGAALVSSVAGRHGDITIAEADVTNLVSDLAGKASSTHTHPESDVTNLVSDLAGKAAATHTHPESDITNLVTDLGAKMRTLNTSTTQLGTDADTNEKTLWSYSLPGGTMAVDNQAIEIVVTAKTATNGNNKTFTLYFGATILCQILTTPDSNRYWRLTAILYRTGAATQLAVSQTFNAASQFVSSNVTPGETLSGPVLIKATGKNGTASANDVMFTSALVTFHP